MKQSEVMMAVGVLLATASTALALDADTLSLETDAADATVTVSNFEFADQDTETPVTVVETGDTVEWVWETGCHSVTEGIRAGNEPATPASFDSQVQCAQFDDDGEALTAFSVTFDEPGVYAYFCKPHPQMEGTVVVTAGGGS